MLTTGLAGLTPTLPATEEETHKTEYAANGDPVLSPSQIATYYGCPRQWAGKYLLKIPDPPAEGTLDGVKMHRILEKYYKHGVAPDNTTKWGKWATKLLKTGLPLPGPGVEAESRFKFHLEGVWWRGSKDLRYDGNPIEIVPESSGPFRIIRDHKSTSDLRWAKTSDELKEDPQSDIYAYSEYLEQDLVVINQWGYVTRKDHPETRVVEVEMPFDDVARSMRTHTETGKRILQLYRDRPDINDLEPKGVENGRCEAFNGCKLAGRECRLTSSQRLRGIRKQQLEKDLRKMNAAQLIRMRAAAKAAQDAGGVVPTAVAAETPPPVAPPAAVAAPVVAPAPAVAAPAPAPAASIRAKLAAQAQTSVAPAPFTPPTEAPPPAVDLAPPADAVKVPAPRGRAAAKARASAPAPVPHIQTYMIPAVAQASADVRAREDVTEPNDSTLRIPEVRPAAKMVQIPGPPTAGFRLCVNCSTDGEYTLFSRWVAIVHAQLKATSGVEQYNLQGFDGTALFQDALRRVLETNPPVGTLVVDSRTNEGRDALSILERFATGSVTRGF